MRPSPLLNRLNGWACAGAQRIAQARHLGGAAEAQYNATIAAIEAARAHGVVVHGGYQHARAEQEPKFIDVYQGHLEKANL